MKIGDKVQVEYHGEMVTKAAKPKFGNIAKITKHFIVIQYKKYRESFKKTDILAEGWVDMKLWNGSQWIDVDKKVMFNASNS